MKYLLLVLSLYANDMPRGCYRLPFGDVSALPHGYLVIGLNKFFKEEVVKESGDNYFWICTQGRGAYDLYVPPDVRGGKDV